MIEQSPSVITPLETPSFVLPILLLIPRYTTPKEVLMTSITTSTLIQTHSQPVIRLSPSLATTSCAFLLFSFSFSLLFPFFFLTSFPDPLSTLETLKIARNFPQPPSLLTQFHIACIIRVFVAVILG